MGLSGSKELSYACNLSAKTIDFHKWKVLLMSVKGYERYIRVPWAQSIGSCFGEIDVPSYIESKLKGS